MENDNSMSILDEYKEHLSIMVHSIGMLVSRINSASSSTQLDMLSELLIIFNNIKSSSTYCGVDSIVSLCHNTISIIEKLIYNQMFVSDTYASYFKFVLLQLQVLSDEIYNSKILSQTNKNLINYNNNCAIIEDIFCHDVASVSA